MFFVTGLHQNTGVNVANTEKIRTGLSLRLYVPTSRGFKQFHVLRIWIFNMCKFEFMNRTLIITIIAAVVFFAVSSVTDASAAPNDLYMEQTFESVPAGTILRKDDAAYTDQYGYQWENLQLRSAFHDNQHITAADPDGGNNVVYKAYLKYGKGYRTEIEPDADKQDCINSSNYENCDYWYGWRMYIPSNFEYDSKWEVVGQWNTYGSMFGNGIPALKIHLWEKDLKVTVRWNNNGTLDNKVTYREPYKRLKGKWTNFVVHARWANNPTGYFKMWMNGKVITDYKGPLSFGQPYGPPSWAVGIYKRVWDIAGLYEAGTVRDDRTLYFDDLRWGKSSATYNDVAPPK
jgi:hypothetical protein